MAPRGPLHDVELVEDDEPDDAVPRPPRTTTAADGPHRRRALVVGAAVLSVVLVGAAVGQTVVDRRERARVAAVAALPGAVAPLAGPPSVLWEATDEEFYTPDVRVGDLLVGVTPSGDGPVAVTARDARTGERTWRTELIDGTQRPVAGEDAGTTWSGSCAQDVTADGEIVCLVHDGVWDTSDPESELVASTVRAVTLDPRDGTVVTDLTEALGLTDQEGTIVVLGDLVVVAFPGPGGGEVRAATSDGAPAWRQDAPADSGPDGRGAYVTTVGDLVAVVREATLELVDATGEPVRTVPLRGGFVTGIPGTMLVVVPNPQGYERGADGAPADSGRSTSTVVHAGGVVDVTGEPVFVTLDDGSVPGLVLTTVDSRLTAWDDDGRERWSADIRTDDGVLVLDGRVHLEHGAELVALDARTGAELWRSDVASRAPVTDGQQLLALAAAPGRGRRSEVVALDPADGSERWRGPLPDGTDRLEARLRVLVAVSSGAGSRGDVDDTYRVLG